jgi:pimeloyl-ACP methyl ester carboxylesterase/DNA-binding CsgD family transcriptional regulator
MSEAREQIRFCTSRDGTRIAYAICGAGPPLVWAPHWVRHIKFDWISPVWRPWMMLLTRRHTVIRYDWRGCGLSDRDGVELSPARYLEDFEAVVRSAGVDRFTLLAMSHGTRMSMSYAVHNPERVSRLILFGASPCGRVALGQSAEQAEEEETRLKAIQLGWQTDNPAYGQFFTALHVPDATPEQFRSLGDLLRLTTSPANAVAIMRTFHRADVRDIVSKVACPTLVLHSRGDCIIPFDWGRAVAAQIPAARFLPLESRNHVLVDTEPAWPQLVEAIEDFLPASPDRAGVAAAEIDDLSPRENEVLEFVAQGLDNATIAKRLGISERTARNHVSAILSKLGVNSRAQAIVRAREAGFGQKTSKSPGGWR